MVRGYEEAGYMGAYSRAAETLVELSDKAHVAPFWVAWYYTAAGQKQKAFDWLERGIEEHGHSMPGIGSLLAFET